METANLALPTAPLYELKPANWPYPPRVKEYDSDGAPIEKFVSHHDEVEAYRSRNAKLLYKRSIRRNESTLELDNPIGMSSSTKRKLVSSHIGHSDVLSSKGSDWTESKLGPPTEIMSSIKSENVKNKRIGRHATGPKMTKLALWDFLRKWDDGGFVSRRDMTLKFLEDYTTQDPLDMDSYFTNAGSLLSTRFTVGLQLKKSVSEYFQALEIFIKSLQGERFTYEFALAGGFITTFEVLRVHEMTYCDKMHAFQFLTQVLNGKGGCSTKRFLCSENSYMESVVDCMTMCQDEMVINAAKLFLENLCIGNTAKNIIMISKYIISLLPFDFNPKVQGMACYILKGIIHQNEEIAANCYTHVVDVLKSDYDDTLVDVGDICLAIMETKTAGLLILDLIESMKPNELTENLSMPDTVSSSKATLMDAEKSVEEVETKEIDKSPSTPRSHDPYFRLQYGSIFVLSYMLKNETNLADTMIENGVIGSILSAIGTPCYTSVQLEAIRLLLLLHELTPDCSLALASLLPKSLLSILYEKREESLQYVTAVMCLILRRLGGRLQENWAIWFQKITISQKESFGGEVEGEGEEENENEEENESLVEKSEEEEESESGLKEEEILSEINILTELLHSAIDDPMLTIVEKLRVLVPNSRIFEAALSSRQTSRLLKGAEKVSPGEIIINETEALESFRKYLRKDLLATEKQDEFEKYYAAKFIFDSDKDTNLDMDALQTAALKDAENALKDPFKVGDEKESGMMDKELSNAGQETDENRASFEEESNQMLNI